MANASEVESNPSAGWVLYDDDCDFCRRWVARFEDTLRERGFGLAPLQTDWVRERLGLTNGELVADIRLLLPNGEQVTGADVYRHCMRRIWWARPLWLLSVLPLAASVFDAAYRNFARNRYCASPACPRSESDDA